MEKSVSKEGPDDDTLAGFVLLTSTMTKVTNLQAELSTKISKAVWTLVEIMKKLSNNIFFFAAIFIECFQEYFLFFRIWDITLCFETTGLAPSSYKCFNVLHFVTRNWCIRDETLLVFNIWFLWKLNTWFEISLVQYLGSVVFCEGFCLSSTESKTNCCMYDSSSQHHFSPFSPQSSVVSDWLHLGHHGLQWITIVSDQSPGGKFSIWNPLQLWKKYVVMKFEIIWIWESWN